jgi:hypothetical protein
MGNTPSTTPNGVTPTKTETTNIEACDLKCQKAKDLALLKTAYEKAATTQDEDATGYEKARIAYFTLLNGPGWLAQEKARIAKQDVEPVLVDYRTRYNAAKGQQQSQSMFTKLMDGLKAQEEGDTEDSAFLNKQLNSARDKAITTERMNELGGPTVTESVYYYISYLIDLLIALLGLVVLYLVYTRFIKSASPSSSVVNVST